MTSASHIERFFDRFFFLVSKKKPPMPGTYKSLYLFIRMTLPEAFICPRNKKKRLGGIFYHVTSFSLSNVNFGLTVLFLG